ncbi:hypothetical protein N3K66_003936 [Trichothecium roseum]|uniref:Uncharacterized protein n=1 Tax=Trichothecium roseum TaxID=47278 RepID=A0ACC0V8S5_9HYPO|nr:hypothetical protein N3K66_003936 [Trichothecium roseum]
MAGDMFSPMMNGMVFSDMRRIRYAMLPFSRPLDHPGTFTYVDSDSRRTTTVTFEKAPEELKKAHQEGLQRLIWCRVNVENYHPNNIYISADDKVSLMVDPDRDDVRVPFYVGPDQLGIAPERISIIRRHEMEEVRRISDDVDLVCYPHRDHLDTKLSVFKYYYMKKNMFSFWVELQVYLNLPKHPNLLPLEKVVIDEKYGLVVGFTTPFVKGGSWATNPNRVFKLRYLRQLCQVVDEVNFGLGIVHQDITMRNLLLDETTDSIVLFDWDFAAHEEGSRCVSPRIDVWKVLETMYSFITGDSKRMTDANFLGQPWTQRADVLLDAEPKYFKSEATHPFTWKTFPKPPKRKNPNTDIVTVDWAWDYPSMLLARLGEPVIDWLRPAYFQMKGEGLRTDCAGNIIGYLDDNGVGRYDVEDVEMDSEDFDMRTPSY